MTTLILTLLPLFAGLGVLVYTIRHYNELSARTTLSDLDLARPPKVVRSSPNRVETPPALERILNDAVADAIEKTALVKTVDDAVADAIKRTALQLETLVKTTMVAEANKYSAAQIKMGQATEQIVEQIRRLETIRLQQEPAESPVGYDLPVNDRPEHDGTAREEESEPPGSQTE